MDKRTAKQTLACAQGGICGYKKCMSHTFRDCQRRAPLVSQNVEANAAVGVDVGVVDASCEVNFRGLERIVGREVDGEEENTTRVRGVALKKVSITKSSTNVDRRYIARRPLSVTRAGDNSQVP